MSEINIKTYVTDKAPQPFSDVLRILGSELVADDFALFCWIVWKLWNKRNSLAHGKEGLAPEVLLEQGVVSFGEWSHVYHNPPVETRLEGAETCNFLL